MVAPKADAKTRAVLKKTLVPQTKTDTKVIPVVTPVVPPTVTGSSGKNDKAFPNLKQDLLNLQTGSSSTTSTTSTTLPKVVVTPTTLPNNTTPTTMVKNNTSTTTTSTLPKDRQSPPPTTVFTNSESSAVVPSAPITPKSSPTQFAYGPQVFYYPEKFRNIPGAIKPGKVTAYPNYAVTPTAKNTKTNNLPPGAFQSFGPSGTPSTKKTSKTK